MIKMNLLTKQRLTDLENKRWWPVHTAIFKMCNKQGMDFPGDSRVKKNLPAKQDAWDQPLGQEDSLEEEMAPHSSILAWKIPWTVQSGGLQPMG